MSYPDPMYENQSKPAVRLTVEGLRFFDINNSAVLQEIEYKYAHYCRRYNLEPVLLIVLPDAILFFANDPDGNTSMFLSAANSTLVRSLNKRLGHSGPMIKPGKLSTSGILDKHGEIDCLAELAAAPTIGIKGTSHRFVGTIFTPESNKKVRSVKRPSHLSPKTYPEEEITYRIAKPRLQKDDSWEVIEDRLAARRKRIEKENRRKLHREGRSYPGVKAPEMTNFKAVPRRRLAPEKLPRLRGEDALVAAAIEQLRHFRGTHRVCVELLRADHTEIVWPAGTNFQHKINGFPRDCGDWLTPPPPH